MVLGEESIFSLSLFFCAKVPGEYVYLGKQRILKKNYLREINFKSKKY